MEWYVGNEWKLETKGLRKKVLAIDFKALDKPDQVSKVVVRIDQVQNLNGRPSKFLLSPEESTELEMGTALTPVDYYVELLIRQMIVGQQALCSIRTKNDEISFVVTLEDILESQEIQKLNVKEMYILALRYKENGVIMFKAYPQFAHDYFSRAAKCLISYKPFDNLSLKQDGVAQSDMQSLFLQIQTNLAACLLLQKRYEDVIYQTRFVMTMAEPSEKSIYRRAMAFFHIEDFEQAQKTIEKIPNYQEKKEFLQLYLRIAESWKSSNDRYKHVVQRMFS